MLSGKLWPAHPKPFPDEILSSWIVRVAEANAIKLQTLCWMLFGNARSPWNRDVDRSAPKWLLKAISEHTGTNYWDAYRTTLTTYRNWLYPRRQSVGQLRWVLPIRGYGMRRQGFGMQFCPECLMTDPIPYFRRHWRLALFTFCPVHYVVLYDSCPVCKQPVMYYRRDFGKELPKAGQRYECSSCQFDFRRAVQLSPVFLSSEIEALFRQMLSALLAQNPPPDGFDLGFFQILHQLTRIMVMRQNAGRLLAHTAACLGLDPIPISGWRTPIEQRSLQERHQLLGLGLWLLADLKPRLTEAWRGRAVRYNLLTKDLAAKPKWYESVVKDLSDWRRCTL